MLSVQNLFSRGGLGGLYSIGIRHWTRFTRRSYVAVNFLADIASVCGLCGLKQSVELSGILPCAWDILGSNFGLMTGCSDTFLVFLFHGSSRQIMR